MKTSVIQRSWIEGYGYRLDTKPYLGGALEAKVLLEKLALRKDKLHTLTVGFEGGIYNGPHFSRTFVDSPEFGVPFVGGSSMLHADLSDLPLLSKKQTLSPKLAHLELKPGMSLISCSGTIGKMLYARREMDGMWSSQHIMKVVADPSKIPSGYLYAYLCSKFGVPLIASGTYGAIIQSINPEHIWELPVPRLGDALEHQIHDLVEQASELRTKASVKKKAAIATFVERCHLPMPLPIWRYPTPHFGQATSARLTERMDSTYYVASCAEARAEFDAAAKLGESKTLGELAEVFVPTIFKRLYAPDPEQGIPYITGADVFCIQPRTDLYLMRSVAQENRLVLESGMIVLHEAGQRYGLIGRGVMVGRTLDGFACTNNMVRLVPHNAEETGYIFSVLSSEFGLRLMKREAAGSSIPHLDASRVSAVSIPWPKEGIRRTVAALAHEARESWDKADEFENRAVETLVAAIESST